MKGLDEASLLALLPKLWALAYHLTGDSDRASHTVLSAYRSTITTEVRSRQDRNRLFLLLSKKIREFSSTNHLSHKSCSSLESPVSNQCKNRLIVSAVMDLPEDERNALILIEAEGLDVSLAAEILGMSNRQVLTFAAQARIIIGRRLLS